MEHTLIHIISAQTPEKADVAFFQLDHLLLPVNLQKRDLVWYSVIVGFVISLNPGFSELT